jgi:hypothetical protein
MRENVPDPVDGDERRARWKRLKLAGYRRAWKRRREGIAERVNDFDTARFAI